MSETYDLIIACEVFKDELESLKDQIEADIIWIDRSMHDFPDKINIKIKETISEVEKTLPTGSTVLLFYGNCGGALDGIGSDTLNIIYPDLQDCIPILLGAMDKYRQIQTNCPGTFYLNKAWIDSGAGPLNLMKNYQDRYGEKKGLRAAQKMYKSYTHFMLIDNCGCPLEPYREHIQEACQIYAKEFIEIKGNLELMSAILNNTSNMRKIPARG